MTSIYDYRLIYTDSTWAWFGPEMPDISDRLMDRTLEKHHVWNPRPGQVFKVAWDEAKLLSFLDLEDRYIPWTIRELYDGKKPMLRNWLTHSAKRQHDFDVYEVYAGTRWADFVRMIEHERGGKVYYPKVVLEILEEYHGEVREWLEDVHGYTIKGVRSL